MTTTPTLTISADVAALLGSDDAINHVRRAACKGYQCTVCAQPGALTADDPASVIIVLHDGGASSKLVRLAHGWCSDSGVRVLDAPMTVDLGAIWPGRAWLRPEPDHPRAVLLIAPVADSIRVTAGGGTVNTWFRFLLGAGFDMVMHPDDTLPHMSGLVVRVDPRGHVIVIDDTDTILWDGAMTLPPGWVQAAHTAGSVGVVFASGLRVDDIDADDLADLGAAILDGSVIGAACDLLADTPEGAPEPPSVTHRRFSGDNPPSDPPTPHPMTPQVNPPAAPLLRKVTGPHDHHNNTP